MSDILLVEKRDGVGFVTLNRPQIRNAFDETLIAGLGSALANLDADTSVRAVVLGGAGTAFCAGADLNWMKRMAGYGYEQNLADARALAAGATSEREPADQFYGDRSGGVRDPAGNLWWIATHVEDVPEDEMAKRIEELKTAQQAG